MLLVTWSSTKFTCSPMHQHKTSAADGAAMADLLSYLVVVLCLSSKCTVAFAIGHKVLHISHGAKQESAIHKLSTPAAAPIVEQVHEELHDNRSYTNHGTGHRLHCVRASILHAQACIQVYLKYTTAVALCCSLLLSTTKTNLRTIATPVCTIPGTLCQYGLR